VLRNRNQNGFRCCRLAAFAASSAAGDWEHVDRKSATLNAGPDLPTDTPTPSEPASQRMAAAIET
jgi:hypothetical protein